MPQRLPIGVAALESKVARDPESEVLLDELLFAYLCHEKLHGDPRRIVHICRFVSKFPRASTCRTPILNVNPKVSADGYRAVETEWLRQLGDNPGDPEIVAHAALFIANADRARALDLLRPVVRADPTRATAWHEMGRIAPNPVDRLHFFRKANELGDASPNLQVWIACLETEVGDFEAARESGRILLALAEDARAVYGQTLGWPERGHNLWERANARCPDDWAAMRLVNAIGTHANNKHWGNTVMGLVAVHEVNIDAAASHLRQSGEVVGNARLGSYGPAMTLAAALVDREEQPDFPRG